jgi:mycothiol S-conjugate amidase
MWSRARILARHQAFLDLGLESPYDDSWFERPDKDDQITTRIPIDGFTHVRRDGLLAHATQIDPASAFWFGLPEEIDQQVHPFDDYLLAVGPEDTVMPEDDLFAGLRPTSVPT